MSILRIEYWELEPGIQVVDVEDGEFNGLLAEHGGIWGWSLFEGADTQAFASGTALTEGLAKDDLQGACIDRICDSIY